MCIKTHPVQYGHEQHKGDTAQSKDKVIPNYTNLSTMPSMEAEEVYAEALTADGFEDALLGFGHQYYHAVAIYDKDKCIEILMTRDGMSYETAIEYFDFNVTGAWVGEHTPVFLEQKTVMHGI
jgi:hypothetical protein